MGGSCIMADRPSGRARPDPIGLRAASHDRLLIAVVAAMSFLAALAMAGNLATTSLADHWLGGARNVLTIEVPDPTAAVQASSSVTRIDAVLAALRQRPTLSAVRALSPAELGRLLKPWLGDASSSGGTGIALPGVIIAQGDARASPWAIITPGSAIPVPPEELASPSQGLSRRPSSAGDKARTAERVGRWRSAASTASIRVTLLDACTAAVGSGTSMVSTLRAPPNQ